MFINTQYFSPVVRDGLCKAHPLSAEFRSWWQEQKQRCLTGYEIGGVRITGSHYWYLNFWKIRGVEASGRKGYIYPKFTDLDYDYFNEVDKARLIGKNMCVTKARQKGFSEKNAAIIGREFTLFKNSQSVITAGQEKYTENTMKMVTRGLASLDNTEFYKRKNPELPEYVQARYKIIDNGVSKWRGTLSEIYSITSKNNNQALSRLSPNLVLFEEVGVWPDFIEAYRFVQPMLRTEGKKTGFVIIVGTGGDMDKGAKDLRDMFYDPAAFDLMEYDNVYSGPHGSEDYEDENTISKADRKKVAYFVPAWKYMIIDENGNSKRKESMDMLMAERETQRKSKNPNAYYIAVTQNAITPEESFLITGNNIFNRDKLYARLTEILKSKQLSSSAQKGNLEWIRVGDNITGVEWKANPNGKFIIFEHPQLAENGKAFVNLYFGATDSYDRDESQTSSKLSSGIFKGYLDSKSSSECYVARYTDRPKTSEEAFENSAKLMMYYNCQNLIEYSNLTIFKWYRDHGFEYMLKERPRVVYDNIKDSKMTNRYGVDPATKWVWLNYYKDYIEDNTHKMLDHEQVELAINFRNDKSYNCDITIQAALCITHYKDNIQLKVKQTEVVKDEFLNYTRVNGQLVTTFDRSN